MTLSAPIILRHPVSVRGPQRAQELKQSCGTGLMCNLYEHRMMTLRSARAFIPVLFSGRPAMVRWTTGPGAHTRTHTHFKHLSSAMIKIFLFFSIELWPWMMDVG